MIGDMPIVRMRKSGMAPKSVWVWVGTSLMSLASQWHEIPEFWAFPEVEISPADKIETLDLRFAIGLQVHIDGNDSKERILAAHRAFSYAGASGVFTLLNGSLIFNPGVAIEHSAA